MTVWSCGVSAFQMSASGSKMCLLKLLLFTATMLDVQQTTDRLKRQREILLLAVQKGSLSDIHLNGRQWPETPK